MKIVVYCVNYNTYQELDSYIKSIELAVTGCEQQVEVTVVVADNSEQQRVYKHCGSVNVNQFFTGGNLGYFGGIAKSIAQTKYKLSDYDFIIFSNVDICISSDFFEKLNKQTIGEDVGCIAPSILSVKENINRNPKVLNRYPRWKLQTLILLFRFPVLWRCYNRFFHAIRRKRITNNINKKQDIYAAHGSFILFTKRFAGFLQDMVFPAFLFGEELFIAENLKKQNLRTMFIPELIVYDTDHVNTSKMKQKEYYKYNYESLQMIIKEYYHESI